MHRMLMLFGFMFAVLVPTLAEEFALKDGTKIVGHMVAIKGDKIELQTSYGKMQIRRSDILSISFPENSGVIGSESNSGQPKARPVDESLAGTDYVNRTGHFALRVPIEWKTNPELRSSAGVLAALSSRDDMRFVLVEHESFAGSLESYKGLIEVQARRNLTDYEKLSESNVTVDGSPAVLITFRGVNAQAQNLPLEFIALLAIVNGEALHGVAWCVEPLFNESQRTLENILLSYRKLLDGNTSSSPESDPSLKAAPTTRLSVSTDAQVAKMIDRAEPEYPPLARQTRVQGTVHLHAIIGKDGGVKELEVISGHPLLIQSAMDAVRKWRYAPTILNGQPVEVDTTVDVIFILEEKGSTNSTGSSA
jgi:TonB family protein